MKREWTICWLSLTVAIILTGAGKWCYGQATIVTARAIEADHAGRMAARASSQEYQQTGQALTNAGIMVAVVGCVAWLLSVRKKQAGTPALPIILLAVYLLLSIVMV